jgi:hypothetical protein
MSLSLDGSIEGNNAAAASLVVSLTTTAGSGVIVVGVLNGNDSNTVTSVTASGLTFTSRGTTTGGGDRITQYTAPYTTNFSGNITVNLSASDYVTVIAFGVGGAATSNYFDPNLASPVVGTAYPGSITTTNANDFIYAIIGESTGGDAAGSGYTRIGSSANYNCTEYQIVSTTQSALSVTIGTGAWDVFMADAIIAAGGGGGGNFVPYNPWPQIGPLVAQ